MAKNKQEFISIVGPLAQAEYIRRGKANAILPSVCIAQGALESGWNTKAKTVFGIKGAGIKLPTKEEYTPGVLTSIVDSFKLYPDISGAVVGYYDFIAKTKRYRKCLNNDDYKSVVYNLQHATDGLAYATDSEYESKIIKIIERNDLTRFDKIETETTQTTQAKKSIEEVAREIIRGWYIEDGVKKSWGNGAERQIKLQAAGYNYCEVQAIVNKLLK